MLGFNDGSVDLIVIKDQDNANLADSAIPSILTDQNNLQ
jgi:hypothetical protein